MFDSLEHAGADVSYILRQCGCPRRAKLLPSKVPVRAVVSFSKHSIAEQGGRWLNVKNGDEVLNCAFRIENTIRDRDSGELFYFGTITYKDQSIRFLEKLAVVRDQTVTWLQRELAQRNADVFVEQRHAGVVVAHASFKRHLHQIAVMFHEPQFVEDELWKWVKKVKDHGKQNREVDSAR
jgi:hypothetical protein